MDRSAGRADQQMQTGIRVVPKAERTGGMLWFGDMAYVLAISLGKEED